MYGNSGKMAKIDLNKGTFAGRITTPYLKKYLGGRALNHILLFRETDTAKVKPFDLENVIIFG